MSKKLILMTLIALAIFSTSFCEEYKIITKSEDGRYYLDEETVVLLANYIAKLEALNQNYSAQISTLEKLVANLKAQIAEYETLVKSYEARMSELEKKLASEQKKRIVWTVIAAVSIGGVILLFLK